MKKWIKVTCVAGALLVLGGCGKLSFDSDSTSQVARKTGAYETTGASKAGTYQGVIKNGKYQVSKSRGLMLENNNQNGNTFNVRSMETGLTTLATKQFSTDKYSLAEGQLLTSAVTRKWLGRQKGKYTKTDEGDNKLGLNPARNNSTDPNKRVPVYLQQLLEQDFMVRDGNGMKLGGVAVGLGMNSTDYYTKERYGATFESHISQADMMAHGKAMASEVIARLRKQSKVGEDTPIMVAIYKQADRDSLVGGTYQAYAVSEHGNKVSEWHEVNEENEVLPIIDGKKAIDSNVANDFNNFASQVRGYFPTLAGVTAQAHYRDKTLAGLKITVNTQFYGQSEINSFINYVTTAASKYLPGNTKIEIDVMSVQGMQAFAQRNSDDKTFYTHVFDSY